MHKIPAHTLESKWCEEKSGEWESKISLRFFLVTLERIFITLFSFTWTSRSLSYNIWVYFQKARVYLITIRNKYVVFKYLNLSTLFCLMVYFSYIISFPLSYKQKSTNNIKIGSNIYNTFSRISWIKEGYHYHWNFKSSISICFVLVLLTFTSFTINLAFN